MIMKHTPGPWVTSPEPNGKEWVVDAGPWGICVCADAPGLGTAEANARLIAAAPELLDELIEQDKFLGVLAGTVPLSEKDTHRRIAMHRESVRAAIAKAIGSV